MSATDANPVPSSIRLVLIILIIKTFLAIAAEFAVHVFPPTPLPFTWGVLSFVIPAVIVPILIANALVRSPAAGYWATLAYAVFSLALQAALWITPRMLQHPIVFPNPDPYAFARMMEDIVRYSSIGLSVLLLVVILQPSAKAWVLLQERQLGAQRYPTRKVPTLSERAAWILPLCVGIVTPTLVWLAVQMLVGKIWFGDAMMDILLEHLKGRGLFLDLFSLIPFVVLALIGYYNSGRMSTVTLWAITVGGLAGILALMVPLYFKGWETIYNDIVGDEKSTGALIFFFTPLYCLATLLAGMLLGWAITRFFRKGGDDLFEDHM